MDLSNLTHRVKSKTHVDFNDARYQLSDKLRPAANRNMRQSFTLYDDKSANKVSVNDISAAYALSDKKIPVGELLDKMLDLIIDLQDGVLDTQEDAVYAWKFSQVLVRIFEDRIKHGESISAFDNSLKNSIINSEIFNERYPNKYTLRTNFYDKNVLAGMLKDIVSTFTEDTIPKIHAAAIKQSRETAETHHNEILDKIAQWAVAKYHCEAEAFFEINEDPDTGLMYATNVVILHLKNGYDVSLLGYVGTEHDHKYCISLFNANSTVLDESRQNILQDDVKKKLIEAASKDPVEPLTKLIRKEVKREEILNESIKILSEVKPMISEDILKLKAAESVVGKDYIWGCENYRLTHRDLPDNFKVDDIELPQLNDNFDEDEEKTEVSVAQIMADAAEHAIGKSQNNTQNTDNTTSENDEIEISMTDFYSSATGEVKKQSEETGSDDFLPQEEKYVHNDINDPKKKATGFNKASILLPGVRPEVKKEDDNTLEKSLTANAKKIEKPQEEKTEPTTKSTLLPGLAAVNTTEETKEETPSEENPKSLFAEPVQSSTTLFAEEKTDNENDGAENSQPSEPSQPQVEDVVTQESPSVSNNPTNIADLFA